MGRDVQDWQLIQNYNIRAIGLGTGKTAQGYLVQYLHFHDNHDSIPPRWLAPVRPFSD